MGVPELVTFGESMGLLLTEPARPLRGAAGFARSIAGAESNVAVGLSRLGHPSGWFGRVGDDAFGLGILDALRREGVDVDRARVDPEAPTGLLIRDRHPQRRIQVLYYRHGSAGSRLGPGDVDEGYIAGARVLHVTGITPALSDSCLEGVRAAMDGARRRGVTVCFDPNLRLRLWSAQRAAATIEPLLASADIVLTGDGETEKLSGRGGTMNSQTGEVTWDNEYILLENRNFIPERNYLLPIPQSERDVNPNMTQNDGY